MVSTFIRSLFIGLAGACVVWFAMPYFVQPDTQKKNTNTAQSIQNPSLPAASWMETVGQTDTEPFVEPEATTIPQNVFSAPPAVEEAAPEIVAVVPAEEPAERPAPEEKIPSIPVAENVPAPDGVPAVFPNEPNLPWGIVVTNSTYYTQDMKPLGTIKGGAIISVSPTRMTQYGEVRTCSVLRNKEWTKKTVVLYDADLISFDCRFSEADPAQRDALISFCKALAIYEQLKLQEMKKLSEQSANPYNQTYRAAKERYETLTNEAAEMRRQYDETTYKDSPDKNLRGRLAAQLNAMRPQITEAKNAFEQAEEQWDAWNEEHPEQERKLQTTPQMREQINRMKALKDIVDPLVPGLVPPFIN